ncbi:MAG TPA: ABC transporter permease [Blastocatellia bacterium]|jgi:putative ABC transport system permease protein|nr:ABC transporter permease [Blastocatellia bacterium]
MDNLIAANVKQRPLRTAISVIGVSLGVILVVLTVGLARGMQRDSLDRQSNVDAELRMAPPGTQPLASNPLMFRAGYARAIMEGVQPTDEDPDLEPKPPIPGAAAASPVGEMIQSSAGGIGFEMVDGIDFESFVKTTQLRIVEGRALGDGRSPGSDYEAIIDRFYAENNKSSDGRPVKTGSKITVLGNEFTVVGIYEPPILGRVKIPLYTMQQLFGGADNCTFVMVKTERPELAEEVKESIERYYPGNRLIFTRDLPALYSQGINAVEIFLNVVIGLAMIISTLVILLAMYTTIIERTREIGILKSLGASKRFIVISIEKEAALISLMGVLFGFLVSVIGKYGIEASTRLKIDLDLRWLLLATSIALAGGLIGALYPALRAANLDPVEAISYE